jgi:hypothetical protein
MVEVETHTHADTLFLRTSNANYPRHDPVTAIAAIAAKLNTDWEGELKRYRETHERMLKEHTARVDACLKLLVEIRDTQWDRLIDNQPTMWSDNVNSLFHEFTDYLNYVKGEVHTNYVTKRLVEERVMDKDDFDGRDPSTFLKDFIAAHVKVNS